MGKAPFDFITTRTSHPLDKGWSWVIMLAAFGSQFIVIGYQRSFGLLFVALQERYGYSSALLSVVNGTQSLTYSFSTMLVMNYLLKKISIRTACLIGACLEAGGVIACSLSSDMISLIVCQGFLFGLGHSFLYCPTILILSQYFDAHRSIATAVALCGAAIGGIAFPYISRLLLNTYGLHGALLILGALIFHQAVFYALFQPIVLEEAADTSVNIPSSAQHLATQNESQLDLDNPKNDNNGYSTGPYILLQDDCDGNPHHADSYVDDACTYENGNQQNGRHDKSGLFKDRTVDITPGAPPTGHQLSSSQVLKPVTGTTSLANDIHLAGKGKLYSSHGVIPTTTNGAYQTLSQKSRELLTILGGSTDGIHSSLPAIMAHVHYHKGAGNDVLTDDNDMQIALPNGATNGNSEMSQAPAPVGNTEDAPIASLLGKEDCKPESRKGCPPAVMRMPTFWLVAAYSIGSTIAAGCPAIYIPPLAKEKGLSNAHATFFLTISATTDFVGRIASGLVLHFKLLNPCKLALVPLGLGTLFFNLTPLFNDFGSVLLLTLQYGFASSMIWTLMSLVIIDVLGLANLGPAMGFYAVISGLTTSASFPIAGWLRDETGSYSSSFHYFGAMSFLAALGLATVLIIRRGTMCRP